MKTRSPALVFLASVVLFSPGVSLAQPARTGFNPAHDGFRFTNSFHNDLVPKGLHIPNLNVHTTGLCGGMVYAALDYYYAHEPIPRQPYRPATGTRLARYIYHRELQSIAGNVPEWSNLITNPGGARNVELFRRGLDGRHGGALATLMSFINRGKPVVLGLKGVKRVKGIKKTANHQVLAIGYGLGRYRGDLGRHEGDLRIYVYDPDHPGKTMTMVPVVRRHMYRYTDGDPKRWRSYFVDTTYRRQRPPRIPNPVYPTDGEIHELVLSFATGNDDLRGGHANVNLEVDLSNGSSQFYRNINRGARWLPNYTENARVVLRHPVRRRQIRRLVLTDTFRSGINHDKWNVKRLDVKGLENNMLRHIGHAGFKRFTVKDRRLEVPITLARASRGQIDKLVFTFHTGGDALRGHHDNLNIEIHYAGGRVQSEPNVNHGARWANNSTHVVSIHLDRAVRPRRVKRIILVTTASRGFHSDKWNMRSVRVTGAGNGVHTEIAAHGFNRFTPRDRRLVVSTAHS